MGKHKNNIKNKFDTCFCCGKKLETIEDKIIHRINKNKGVSKNNIVILCKNCKYKFSLGGLKLYNIIITKEILKEYFRNLEKNYKNIILKSLQYQRFKNGK